MIILNSSCCKGNGVVGLETCNRHSQTTVLKPVILDLVFATHAKWRTKVSNLCNFRATVCFANVFHIFFPFSFRFVPVKENISFPLYVYFTIMSFRRNNFFQFCARSNFSTKKSCVMICKHRKNFFQKSFSGLPLFIFYAIHSAWI